MTHNADSPTVACMDCGWTGQHKNGPIQGAKCPNCGGGTIIPRATPLPPRKGVTAWHVGQMEENGDEFFVLTFHHGLGEMTRLDLGPEDLPDLIRSLTAALEPAQIDGSGSPENGSSIVEYAMLIALISLVCIFSVSVFGGAVDHGFSQAWDCTFNNICKVK